MEVRGIRNNNPLNIRRGNNWQGERHPQKDRQFEEFLTIEDGLRAAFILACNYITGKAPSCKGVPANTVTLFINKWAPPSENNTAAYIRRVCELSALLPHEPLFPFNKRKLCLLLQAMAVVECGRKLPAYHFTNAYALARLVVPALPA